MVAVTSADTPCGQHGASKLYPGVCVHQLFEEQVVRSPEAVAVVFRERRLSYQELNRRANQVAHFLRKNGVHPETLVGVCMERSPELVIALLGVWKAGGAYVPLDPAYPRERLSFMVSDASLRILLTDSKGKDLLSSDGVMTVSLDGDDAGIAHESTENPDVVTAPSNLAYVMYTSGSTGQPKGAMILQEGLVNYLLWAIETYAVRPSGSVPVHSSIAFDLTVTSLYPALLAGGQVELLAEDVGAQNLLASLRTGRGRNLVKITPAHLDVLTQQLRPEELAGLTDTFVIGGENLPAESLSLWRDFAPRTRLINEYGPTETVVGCCIHEVQPADARNGPVPIGRAIANTQLYVLDDALQPVSPGVMGELYIGGAGVARGYLNRPELTRERFLLDRFSGRADARLYKTGDLARERADGTLEFLGRVDNQVKVRGYRIELGEIEATLASHPAVQSCAVLAREDTPGNKQLVGYVVPREGQQPAGEEIRTLLAQRLPEYMMPAHIVFLESMPLTLNGKVDRKALPAPSAQAPSASRAFTPPRNETERAIADIWRELLKIETVGVEADFFDLGGHSLLAVRALAMVRDLLGVDLPPQTLFERSRLEELAALVDQAKGTAEDIHRIPPRKTDGPCAVSFAQQQMWLLHQLAPDSPAYNIVDLVSLPGPFDAKALKRALTEMVNRHEILRTAFSSAGGELTQIVHAPFEPELAEVDLSSAPQAEREGEWARVVREQACKPFDLSQLPLVRASVVHRSPADHAVLLVIHHVIADEWSMEVIHEELLELYEAFARGRPSRLDPLTVQYADFALWQRETLRGEALATHLAYWGNELKGASSSLALPIDKPRPSTPTGGGATEAFELSKGLLDELQALSRREQATLFMTLEAAFAALLRYYTGQDDILVGTPISGRTHTETQRLIGCFLNTVVLRSRFHEELSFRSLLHETRSRALGAYAHAELPFERLVGELSPARDPGRTPLFQVMFILHNRDGVSQVSKVSGNRELETGTSKFEMTLFLSETERGLEGLIEYSTDLFDAETVRRLCRSYGQILDAIARDPNQKIARLPVLADADRRQVLWDWNATSVVFEKGSAGLHELFVRQAARTPEQVALAFGQQTLTYGELDRRSDELASHLSKLGVGPDVLVGLLVERSLDMVVGLLGILKAGGAYVPLDPSFPADRLSYMIEDSRMPVLVTHRALEETLQARPPAVVRLDRDGDEIAKGRGQPPAHARVGAHHLAYVLYTSGSTGKPKGVAIQHSAIVNFLLSMKKEPGLTAQDTLLAVTTLSFDIAALELYLPLITGAKVVIASRDDVVNPHRLMRCLNDWTCTVMQATPATWRALLEAGWGGSSVLKALCGGEALPPDLALSLLPRCRELWNMYGPTETTVWSTVHKMTEADALPPIGRPIANTQVYVLDAHREVVPPGVIGELYIGGRGLARGYLHRAELTAERFVASPFEPGERLYCTGDLARWRADGRLECLGRTDHQVKLRGYRIELGEIEACIARHPAVRQSVVVAREDVPGDRRLVAYVVSDTPQPDLAEELRSLLRTAVPDYMVPAHFVTLESLPLTPNGKVDRKALPAPMAADLATSIDSYVAPRTELETSLAVAWQRVLGVERVGVEDNFFELGGDSLKVVKLIIEIENASSIHIDLGAIFKFPTIASLVKALGSDAAKEASMAVPLQSAGDGRPIYCLCGINMYQEFAHSLGKGQPVFGVYIPEEQALTRDALRGAKLDVDIPRLAKSYYAAIVKTSPRGPYRLAGSSFGGIVALEVASMMRHDGVDVELVALLDTLSPRGIRRNWVKWAYRRASQVVSGEAAHKLLREFSKIQDKLVARGWIPGTRDAYHVAEEAYSLKQEAYFAAIGTWKTRRLVTDFKVVLFRASDQGWGAHNELDDDYGWHHYLTGPIAIVDVRGDHLGILKSPHVAELGRRVGECLTSEGQRASIGKSA
jgi:amino acid adenylation domain-containing protein